MVDRRKIAGNAGTVQVTKSGVILFFLYQYLAQTVGVQKLGVWSVVLATTIAMTLGWFGAFRKSGTVRRQVPASFASPRRVSLCFRGL